MSAVDIRATELETDPRFLTALTNELTWLSGTKVMASSESEKGKKTKKTPPTVRQRQELSLEV